MRFVNTKKSAMTLFFCAIFSVMFGYRVSSKPKARMTPETRQKLENMIYLELSTGRVVIETLPKVAPKHVAQIKSLVRKGFYDGLAFHRVIDKFVAQTGDPKGDGTGGCDKLIPAEFSNLPHKRGAVSMARTSDPNSASSQFFIVTHDSPFLDGQYTIWGYVISGMEHVDKIKKSVNSASGMVENPDRIVSMKMAIDVEQDEAIRLSKNS